MKVAVLGSLKFDGSENVRDNFCEACRHLGTALAKAGHQIIIGSDGPDTADRYIVEGANTVGGSHKVIVYFPEDEPKAPFSGERRKFDKITFSYKKHSAPWPVGRIQQVIEADAVILIGGRRGVTQAGYVAPILQKPVLAIPTFDGAAAEFWKNFLPDYRRVLDAPGLLEDHTTEWSDRSAEVLVHSLEQLVKRNPYITEGFLKEICLSITLLLLFTMWLWVFLVPLQPHLLSFFLLLVSSSGLGTGLRSLLRLISHTSARISSRELIVEGVASVVLAFGFAILYLTGALTVTGDPELLKLGHINDFQRIGIAGSLLGLAAGLLLERTTEKLQHRLEKVIGE